MQPFVVIVGQLITLFLLQAAISVASMETALCQDLLHARGPQVFELDNPIADQMGIIYEKADVVSYIKNKSREGQVVCPVSGTNCVRYARAMRYVHVHGPNKNMCMGPYSIRCILQTTGTRHILSVKDLKPSTQLERAKRRRMMGQGGSATEHVYDADE